MSTTVIKKNQFKERVGGWADRLEAQVTSITMKPMKTKWASYSTTGRLTFDESLLELQKELQDYVIVHELLHSRVPNHGKLWKSLMRAYLGDYERLEDKLKETGNRASLLSTPVKSLSASVNMK
jgi:predicted metal-dependent hydrolase